MRKAVRDTNRGSADHDSSSNRTASASSTGRPSRLAVVAAVRRVPLARRERTTSSQPSPTSRVTAAVASLWPWRIIDALCSTVPVASTHRTASSSELLPTPLGATRKVVPGSTSKSRLR